MTASELISKLSKLDEDSVVVFIDTSGGWTNIEIGTTDGGSICLKPSLNEIFTDDK